MEGRDLVHGPKAGTPVRCFPNQSTKFLRSGCDPSASGFLAGPVRSPPRLSWRSTTRRIEIVSSGNAEQGRCGNFAPILACGVFACATTGLAGSDGTTQMACPLSFRRLDWRNKSTASSGTRSPFQGASSFAFSLPSSMSSLLKAHHQIGWVVSSPILKDLFKDFQ